MKATAAPLITPSKLITDYSSEALADQDIITIRQPDCPICGCKARMEEAGPGRVRYHHDEDNGRVCLARANHKLLGPYQAMKLIEEGSQPEIAIAAYHSLITKVCPSCGGYKEAGKSFCLACYHTLNNAAQRSLYSRERYAENWFGCLRILNPAVHLARF
jgi:hypothetical protein